MLKKKVIRKILSTTIFFFILLAIYSLPINNKNKENFNKNIDVEYVTSINSSYIYLMNEDNFLVKIRTSLLGKDIIENSREVINNLKNISNTKYPSNLKGIIPRNTKVNSIKYDNNVLYLDFNSELLNVSSVLEEKVIESLVFSLTSLNKVEGITITIDKKSINYLPKSNIKISNVIKRDFGINKVYDITDTKNIDKVVMYYITEINDSAYYVPVTKYINNTKERIKVIIENLSSNYIYETNLMSYLNNDTNLIDYKIDNNRMILNFNECIFNNKDEILEEVIYTVSASVFDNYDVKEIEYRVNGKEITVVKNVDVK